MCVCVCVCVCVHILYMYCMWASFQVCIMLITKAVNVEKITDIICTNQTVQILTFNKAVMWENCLCLAAALNTVSKISSSNEKPLDCVYTNVCMCVCVCIRTHIYEYVRQNEETTVIHHRPNTSRTYQTYLHDLLQTNPIFLLSTALTIRSVCVLVSSDVPLRHQRQSILDTNGREDWNGEV